MGVRIKNRLLTKKEVPLYAVEPYVLTGYREEGSFVYCLKSMFQWHNQTVNIWTSVFLVVYNLWLVGYFVNCLYISGYALFFFWMHGLIRAYCWANSWGYHTFVCHSQQIANRWCTLDYIGCYLTPLGMGTNMIMSEFSGHPYIQCGIVGIGVITTSGAIWISLLPEYQMEQYRLMRLVLYGVSAAPWIGGLLISVVIIHDTVPGYYMYLVYALLVECIAAGFYVTMVPERIYPGYFDIILPSHSIWHILNAVFDTLMMVYVYKSYVYNL